MDFRPNIFIGSSKEGLDVAEIISEKMKEFADIKMWTHAFQLGKSALDNLTEQIALYDYAILVATADDVLKSRGTKSAVARDNVLFELGLFVGGLGKERTFFMLERSTKLPTDLLGITLPMFPPITDSSFKKTLDRNISDIKEHILNKEKSFDLGFLPSTALAYGYFSNFVEPAVKRLLKDKKRGREFTTENAKNFKISSFTFTILLPNDLSENMFSKVTAKRLKSGWEKLKVDPRDVRDYDFSVDVARVDHGELNLVDIPLTLNALNRSIEMYSKKQHIGKTIRENVLEEREIKNFHRTLQYLISNSSIAKDIVHVEIVDV